MPQHSKNKDVKHMGTNFLQPRDVPVMPKRSTDNLDLELPHTLRLVLPEMSVLEVPLQSYMVLGRKNSPQDAQVDVDLTPFNAHRHGVSRYHAIISVTNGRLSIKDFNSTNGTTLNGYALQPMHAYRLRHGDELCLGDLTLNIQFVQG